MAELSAYDTEVEELFGIRNAAQSISVAFPRIGILAVESGDELVDDGVYDVGWELGKMS